MRGCDGGHPAHLQESPQPHSGFRLVPDVEHCVFREQVGDKGLSAAGHSRYVLLGQVGVAVFHSQYHTLLLGGCSYFGHGRQRRLLGARMLSGLLLSNSLAAECCGSKPCFTRL